MKALAVLPTPFRERGLLQGQVSRVKRDTRCQVDTPVYAPLSRRCSCPKP